MLLKLIFYFWHPSFFSSFLLTFSLLLCLSKIVFSLQNCSLQGKDSSSVKDLNLITCRKFFGLWLKAAYGPGSGNCCRQRAQQSSDLTYIATSVDATLFHLYSGNIQCLNELGMPEGSYQLQLSCSTLEHTGIRIRQ